MVRILFEEPNYFYPTIFLPLVCSAGLVVRPVGSPFPQFCATI